MIIPRKGLLFAGPIALAAVVAVVLGGLILWPQWRQLQLGRNRLAELRELEASLPSLRRALEQEQSARQKALEQQALVLDLIAGSGSLATFMAQVDELAARSGVQLALYEPSAAPSSPEPSGEAQAEGGSKPASPPPDPLLAPGVAKQEVLLSAVGSYPALLTFMRRMEKLSVLVVQSNLQLVSEDRASPTVGVNTPKAAPSLLLKMRVATYHRVGSPSGSSAAAQPKR
ncbi:MAG: hypothetical protein VKK98_08810 [Cyanobacteriota bacterium]|nr:hypothetical protein [Cyanobacteriota bacterium]